jgi:bifunctional DNA-binding transcriptional regulator/antitoxin component of YhaV-PrlF toxin-antitoxin module
MTRVTKAASASFNLGPKGRFVLPVAIRRAARVPDGATLVAHAEGEGRIVIETRAAISARVWASAPVPIGVDSVADIRELRDEDVRISDTAAQRRLRLAGNDQDDLVGVALLKRLGL